LASTELPAAMAPNSSSGTSVAAASSASAGGDRPSAVRRATGSQRAPVKGAASATSSGRPQNSSCTAMKLPTPESRSPAVSGGGVRVLAGLPGRRPEQCVGRQRQGAGVRREAVSELKAQCQPVVLGVPDQVRQEYQQGDQPAQVGPGRAQCASVGGQQPDSRTPGR
jgi:hypothetical protein